MSPLCTDGYSDPASQIKFYICVLLLMPLIYGVSWNILLVVDVSVLRFTEICDLPRMTLLEFFSFLLATSVDS